jgi:predicted dehydrogenase
LEQVTVALIGAGDRGFYCYAPYIKANPWKVKLVAVAEIDDAKRNACGDAFDIPEHMRFKDMFELLAQPRLADALLICTSDKLHYSPAIKAMEKGYHIMMEKPMSTTLRECVMLDKAARDYDRMFILCYVLRYTEFFTTIRNIIDSGAIGDVNSIVHMENIPLIDQVHAFTRGIFRNTNIACPILLSHCCHDLDLISWFTGAKCKKVASFGGLTYFCEKNAPKDAPIRCLDGCPHAYTCPYYAPNYYLTEDIGWPTSTICTDMSIEGRLNALYEGPYGKCVYHCDNNVCDNQTVIMEFENGVTASFSLEPFASANARTLKIMGTKGEIRANLDVNSIEITDILLGQKKQYKLRPSKYKYGGGDHAIMEYFIDMVERGQSRGCTAMASSLESHIIAFAAEESRIKGIVVDVEKYLAELGVR